VVLNDYFVFFEGAPPFVGMRCALCGMRYADDRGGSHTAFRRPHSAFKFCQNIDGNTKKQQKVAVKNDDFQPRNSFWE